MEIIPPEALLAGYSPRIQRQAERLRRLVKKAVPTATERVRPHWRLIGFDLPLGRRTRYFAWVAIEPIHVHLGFQYGAWMEDPDGVLEGAHLRLKKVRYLTFLPGQAIPTDTIVPLVRQAAAVALQPTGERTARVLDRGWEPET